MGATNGRDPCVCVCFGWPTVLTTPTYSLLRSVSILLLTVSPLSAPNTGVRVYLFVAEACASVFILSAWVRLLCAIHL